MNNNNFVIEWPFFKWQAAMPRAIGNDIFVWLYLSLLVNQNVANKKRNPHSFSKESRTDVRNILKQKFPQIMNDLLLKEIEERIQNDFCKQGEYGIYYLKDDVSSFINSFEYLFADDVETKTIYKDAVSGAILPYFEDLKFGSYTPPDGECYKFDEKILKTGEPATRLVMKAIKLADAVSKSSDPIVPLESKEAVIAEIEYEDEEIYEDDTIDLDEGQDKEPTSFAEAEKSNVKRMIKIINDSMTRCNFYITVSRREEDGSLMVELPSVLDNNDSLKAWFALIVKRNMQINSDTFGKKLLEALPEPKIETTVDKQTILDLYSSNDKLSKCNELYEAVSHSKTQRVDLQIEVIRINDNFHSISGFFHVGRVLDLLGRTIPDTTIRNHTYNTYKVLMTDACNYLGLSSTDLYKLTDRYIYNEYSRPFKTPEKLPFKELLANAILNNMECKFSQFFYKEVVEDAWYLYDMRSKVDHPSGNIKLNDEDIQKLTRLAKFIVSIQGGKML